MLPTMPSKLRKAFGAVKDQTSISLAKVSSTNAGANLEVLILRATTHDEIPINERYVNEILLLVSSDKAHAAACAQAISKRLGKTRNWIVALKSLMLVLRTFQDGDPYFPKEVLHAMKRGAKILNLSSFRDDSNSSPWDYTAFVRTFALYLDERLDCFLTGKLQRRVTCRQRESIHQRTRLVASPVRDMKPAMLLDRISYWQRLIDRAIATRPTGEARTNRLIQISLHAIVQESFDLYRDISEGLARLLDSFFHLQYQSCVSAFQSCVKATKQFRQLSSFYDFCKSIGVGRTSEYPSVQKISEELIETLQDFLRDQASFPSHHARISPLLLPAPPAPRNDRPKNRGSSSERFAYDQSELAPERLSQSRGFGSRSRCTSLEDLMSMTGVSPSMNIEQHEEKQPTLEDLISVNDDSGSPLEQGASSGVDEEKQEPEKKTSESLGLELESQKDGWELVLFESTETQQVQPSTNLANGFEPSVGYSLPQHQYNPFLQDMVEAAPTFQAAAVAVAAPTFYTQSETMAAAAPTFVANNPQETISAIFQKENDPFDAVGDEHVCNGNEKSVLDEQQLWLENQNRIIAKHMG